MNIPNGLVPNAPPAINTPVSTTFATETGRVPSRPSPLSPPAIPSTLTLTTFGVAGCSENQLNEVTLSNAECQLISGGDFSFFTTTNIAADPGCNIFFSTNPACRTADAVIVPNDVECFQATNGIGDLIYARIFCN